MKKPSTAAPLKFILSIIALWLVAFIGAISNIVWLFKASETNTEFWVALLGVIAAPVGIIHGWIVIF